MHRINRTHNVLSTKPITFDDYYIELDMANEGVNRTVAGYPLLYAGKTKSTGGEEIRATQNIPYEQEIYEFLVALGLNKHLKTLSERS